MAAPYKRLCLRAAQTKPSLQQLRTLTTTSAVNASPSSADSDIPTPHPGIKYNASTSPDTPSTLAPLKSLELSSQAHRELEQHREIREMTRLAAWEMPLLSSLSQPFEPPKENQILRWRYTSYLGESHPAARKIVVEFQPSRIPDLTAAQLQKLLKLAGSRYNPSTETIKISCESFETQAQNKRHLANTILSLIAEAKDPNTDAFEDVPLDLRHHKPKVRHQFPQAWVLTPERKKMLEEKRRKVMLEEGKRVEEGKLISGISAIEEARRVAAAKVVEEPVMARAGRSVVGAGNARAGKGQVAAGRRR